jgi:hypothetical protein
MNPLATSALCFSFAASVPTAVEPGHITVGGAVHAETRQRLTSVRVFSDGAPELISELWLTELETVELAQRLLAMESWFRPAVSELSRGEGGEAA